MNPKQNILLIEDDKPLAQAVKSYLEKEGFSVNHIEHGDQACAAILEQRPELVILDLMLPGKDGLTICREVRPQYTGYILMFTAREDEIDQIVGLEIGADDYLIKPVKPRLLLAKVKAFLRRSPLAETGPTREVITIDELHINCKQRTVSINKDDIFLTSAEYDLLLILAEQAGQILSRDEIMNRLTGSQYDGLDRSIDNKISNLRKKLGDDSIPPRRIKTIRSKGYMLVAESHN